MAILAPGGVILGRFWPIFGQKWPFWADFGPILAPQGGSGGVPGGFRAGFWPDSGRPGPGGAPGGPGGAP